MLTSNYVSRFSILLCLCITFALSLAQENGPLEPTSATSTPSATASASYNVFSAIASSSSHNGATGSTDDPRTTQAANVAGASGADDGGLTLSTGTIIAIATVGGAAVVIGIASAILFYLAKKREWKVRERMRRSARKVAAALTPKSATFKRSELPYHDKENSNQKNRGNKKGMVRIDPPSSTTNFALPANRGRNGTPPPKAPSSERSRDSSRESITEKGFGTHTKIEAVKNTNQPKPETPPRSTFDMDSPTEERGKGWSRMFSRR